MADYRDPGWGPAFRRWPLLLLPFPTLIIPLATRGRNFEAITVLRMLWLSFATSLLVLLVVLFFIQPAVGEPSGAELLVLLPLLLANLGGVWWARSRPLTGDTEASAVGAYRIQFFLGVAFAESAALLGFITVFILEALWPYLVGLVAGLLGLTLIAPSQQDIERRQQELTSRGSPLSLGQALLRNTS